MVRNKDKYHYHEQSTPKDLYSKIKQIAKSKRRSINGIIVDMMIKSIEEEKLNN